MQLIIIASICLFINNIWFCSAQKGDLKSLRDSIHLLQTEMLSSKPSELESILLKARKLQNNLLKDDMNIFLKRVEQLGLQKQKNKSAFLFFLIFSRNELFYHHYEIALENCMNAMALKEFAKLDELIYLYTTMATIHYYTSDYVKALENHQYALKLCESQTTNTCASGIYNNISVVYMGTGDWEKAETYTTLALELAEKQQNDFEKSRALGNMAIVFAEQGQFEKSEEWFTKDLVFDLKKGDSISAARNYNNLGRLFEMQNKFQKAYEYSLKGLEIAKLQNDEASVALGYQNLGWIQHKLGKNQEGLRNLEKGMKMTTKLGNRDKLRDALLNMSDFYLELKEPEKALNYFYKYHDLNDSIIGEKNLQAIKELEVKYETQKKENELLKLSKQKQKNELVIAQQTRRVQQLSFGLAGLIIVALLGFFLFKQRLQNKKQEELLMVISETQTEERKRIAQDLHDSIGGSLALTKTKFEAAKNKLKIPSKELESALKTLDQTTHQVRQISHNLMPGELVRFGLVAAINTLLENINEEQINAQFHTNQKNKRLEPIKEIQLYRIVQEALQNILKHAQAKNLFIQLNQHNDELSLMIEDDGKGMEAKYATGMGLKNIKQRVQLLKGIFALDSSPERGTVLNIQIPV